MRYDGDHEGAVLATVWDGAKELTGRHSAVAWCDDETKEVGFYRPNGEIFIENVPDLRVAWPPEFYPPAYSSWRLVRNQIDRQIDLEDGAWSDPCPQPRLEVPAC